MDSKSIARKGVPVRLRDPVFDLDEALVSSGFFLFLAFLRGRGLRRRGGEARASGERKRFGRFGPRVEGK